MTLPSFSPLVRISFGLVLITVSILLAADMLLGLNPDTSRVVLDSRKKLTESMAVQTAGLANANRLDIVSDVIGALVERNPDLLSIAVRDTDGRLVTQAGDHEVHWQGAPESGSTPTHTRVDILRGVKPWGVLEMRFTALHDTAESNGWPLLLKLVLLIAVLGFASYLLFMKRTLRHLDPASVIPDRVKATLDVLSEGVVLVDAKDQIVLANATFSEMMREAREKLLGRRLSTLPWQYANDDEQQELPWHGVFSDGEARTGASLKLPDPDGEGSRTYVVNSAPIRDDSGAPRGALATFDDVSEIERKNIELQELLEVRRAAELEIRRQNERLEYLATRDPLTDCLNRRALFERFEHEIAHARESHEPLACMMCDIDHFKSVNDTFGHAVGDEVIRFFADTLRASLRSIDLIGRYGGEEFCVAMPGIELDEAAAAAEVIRAKIERDGGSAFPKGSARVLTSSFGVSQLLASDKGGDDTVARADDALYASKNGGRNRVTRSDQLSTHAEATA